MRHPSADRSRPARRLVPVGQDHLARAPEAVVFDLDGVLIDSEQLWDEARRELVARHGGVWLPDATAAMQGMSAPEWSRYMRAHLGLDRPEPRIAELVVEDLLARYAHHLPLLPGAVEAVRRIGDRWRLALASSANREIIDAVLASAHLGGSFAVTVSSEEVARGKPSPDVYLAAASRLGVDASACVAIEDSANGIRSAHAAGMQVICLPNPHFPPPSDVRLLAADVIERLDDLTVSRIDSLGGGRADEIEAMLDEEERESFPASDPHSDWAGPRR